MEWFISIVGGIAAVAAYVIADSFSNKPRPDRVFLASVIRKVSWAVLMIGGFCLYVTSPSVKSYRPSNANLKTPTDAEALASAGDYIRDHRERIERLENALAEKTEELETWRHHYKTLVFVLFWPLVAIGASQIFNEKHDRFNGGDS